MKRRDFLRTLGAASVSALVPLPALAQQRDAANYGRLLVLVELKGGNDGLNTVVPYADPVYYELRPQIAIPRDQVLQLDERAGLHPSLKPFMTLWENRELAIVQGVGYANANLSHFRSIEIWETASRSNEYLTDGWLGRAFSAAPPPRSYAADGIVVGGAEMGPFAGGKARTIALVDTAQFLRQARYASAAETAGNPALGHVLRVEHDIVQAAAKLNTNHPFRTEFPAHSAFGNAVRTASQVIASNGGVAAVKLSLAGFDTHRGQAGVHARLLRDLAEGLAALRSALIEIGRWDNTLVMTYAEFGRRPRQNLSNGTDHGTASVQFVMGGRVKGGLYGAAPQLAGIDNGNLPFAVDFRELYATALERWWGVDSARALRGRFAGLDIVRA
jgi:uncharacterized protein (DUF1501 family)